PSPGVDLRKWAVIACDQYTSEPEYWKAVSDFTGDSPSTLHMILPEVYLESPDREQRICEIDRQMEQALSSGQLSALPPGFILVDRSTPFASSRLGLMAAVDLTAYDFTPGSRSMIRATEGTVLERIPPRVVIREHARLEIPHIMVLIDDPGHTVIAPVYESLRSTCPLYETDLMMGSGHITGYAVQQPKLLEQILKAVQALYCCEEIPLFAVGDGNHSLAAAKTHYDNILRKSGAPFASRHPSRFALVEIVNLHDPGLVFHPIHRLMFDPNPDALLLHMASYYRGRSIDFKQIRTGNLEEARDLAKASLVKNTGEHCIPWVSGNKTGLIMIQKTDLSPAYGVLQYYIDDCRPKVDYIHGDDSVLQLAQAPDHTGFFMPAVDKGSLFPAVAREGMLPRKSFSMGEAPEKRFYLECREISLPVAANTDRG
ncbi:MAG TPA: DUF1015 domain-containing protein, partial [Clostridiales bacterium]|nr:DUF1015 domain-containing protein [Clostridiales bacterium]